MYEFLLVLAVLLFLSLKYRETFVIKYGNPFNDEDIISFDPNAKGTRLFAITPDTCPANKPELDAGLCYEQCEMGYHGVGPVCWANTRNVGVGKVLIPKSCQESGHPSNWEEAGPLLCQEPVDRSNIFTQVFGFFRNVFTRRIGAKRLECEAGRENVASLCYAKCPDDLPNRVPGMPYLCFKGTRGLSYGRGAGEVPPLFAFGE
jgi:hypothetical protein